MNIFDKKMAYLKELIEKDPNYISLINDDYKKHLINYYEDLIAMKKNENKKLKQTITKPGKR